MEVFKFGGASVKDAEGVRNIGRILEKVGKEKTLVVISAMGKMTNAFEIVVSNYLENDTKALQSSLADIKEYHKTIVSELFEENKHVVLTKVAKIFEALDTTLKVNKSSKYDFVYDQIVGYGEIVSTTIVSEYLISIGIHNNWLAAGEAIKTNQTYRDAVVDWNKTAKKITALVNEEALTITQGFIASDANNFMTTLGREGSDYTAAIFAYCLNAESVSIWKDVPGVLNADPRVFDKTTLLHSISYEEAIELAFYGASVIHPKTLQPLQRKEIPLYVKSFKNLEEKGTIVTKGQALNPKIPCFIVKKNQVMISLSSLDFSFIVEHRISEIFNLFHEHQIKVDLIQNSAISFSVCVDNKFNTLECLLDKLATNFKVKCQKKVTLFTIRHFTDQAIFEIEKDKEILLKQVVGETYQMIAK